MPRSYSDLLPSPRHWLPSPGHWSAVLTSGFRITSVRFHNPHLQLAHFTDWYGAGHVSDLVMAGAYTGTDLVGKG